jgi:hypothetical protein
MKSNILNECIIVSKEIDDKFILAKNRDRTYKPKLEIIHELIDGVEVLYLHDLQTDWSEGINEFGIGIVNTALVVGYDEKELKIIRKTGNISDDGDKIRTALSKNNLKDAVSSIVKYKKGLRGHTFISSPKNMITVEMSNRTPIIKLVNTKDPLVRTNHGHTYTDAGYSSGKSFESSKIREISAELQITKAKKWYELGPLLRKKFFDDKSRFNMKRDTPKLKTSSQMVLNLTDKIVLFTYFPNNVEKFAGVKNKLPKGYEPKIKLVVEKIEDKASKKPISIKRFL